MTVVGVRETRLVDRRVFSEQLRFAWSKSRTVAAYTLVAIGATLVVLMGVFKLSLLEALNWGFTFVTFVAVQFIENRRQWVESLPKYLTVHFWRYKNGSWEVDATWKMAYLAGVDTMRETIQQLGRQMHGDLLALEGFMLVEDENPKPVWGRGGVQVGKEGASEGWYRHYVVHFPYLGPLMKDQENPEPVLYSSTEDSVKVRTPDVADGEDHELGPASTEVSVKVRTPDWDQIGSFQEAVKSGGVLR